MTLADTARQDGRAKDVSGLHAEIPWPTTRRFERLPRAPGMTVKTPKRSMRLYTDRVRAKPALSPTLSMNIGMTAIGLGLWGLLFPGHVARTLGVRAPAPVVQGLFGLRELWSGITLAGDPTKAGMLWGRVAGDVFDIAVLKSLDSPSNRQRRAARAALGVVLAVAALDLVTAVQMSTVKRNRDQGSRA